MAKKKSSSLKDVLDAIDATFGKGSIRKMKDKAIDYAGISTGVLSLDIALGNGVARGRIHEVYGPESSGKTTLALTIIAQAQKVGDIVAFIDAEHAYDPKWAYTCGVDTDEILISQPNSGEEALEIADMLVDSGDVDLIVIDSVSALTPKAELEGEMGASHMGLQARMMSQALRKLTAGVAKNNTAILFINQIRMKIGVVFGSPETTSGGRALRFAATTRLDLRRVSTIKDKEGVATGNRVRCRVKKNKLAAPFREAEFDIDFATGISTEGDLLELGVSKGVVEKSGSWFNFGEIRLGQGREKAKLSLLGNPDISEEIRKEILK